MTRQSVQSSQIKSIGHDAVTNMLEVEFNSGTVWQYHGVGTEHLDAMLEHESPGSYFHENIKNAFSGKKV